MRMLAVGTLLVALSTIAVAKSPSETLALESSTPSELLAIVQGWGALYDDGEVLLKPKEVSGYEREIAQLIGALEQREDWTDLNNNEKIKLVNLYEKLRAMTDGGEARGNRRICSIERRPGSNLRQNVCISAAEQARIDKLNRAALSDIERNGRRQSTQIQ